MDSSNSIDKKSVIPLYFQLQENLRQKILSGFYKPGDLLPSEKQLTEKFEVSRTTVRQSIKNLEREGLIETKRALGSFVKLEHFDEPILGIRSYTDEALKQGYIPSSKIINFGIINASSEIKEVLKLNENEDVYIIKRLRSLNELPTGIDTSYVPVRLAPNLTRKDFKNTGVEQSLYRILENKYNLCLFTAEEIIDATTVNNEEAIILGFNVNYPINLRIRTVFLPDGTPCIYMKSVYKNRYKIQLRGRVK